MLSSVRSGHIGKIYSRYVQGVSLYQAEPFRNDSDSWTLPASERGSRRKAYEQVVRPAMTQDGTLNEEMQKKAVENVLKRLDLKEAPPLSRIFDFSIARKVVTDLRTKGWKPGAWRKQKTGEEQSF